MLVFVLALLLFEFELDELEFVLMLLFWSVFGWTAYEVCEEFDLIEELFVFDWD
jgi:hypothetical protein